MIIECSFVQFARTMSFLTTPSIVVFAVQLYTINVKVKIKQFLAIAVIAQIVELKLNLKNYMTVFKAG